MKSDLQNKTEVLDYLLTEEIIKNNGKFSDDEMMALAILIDKIRRVFRINDISKELQEIEKIFEKNKRIKELDKPLDFRKINGEHPLFKKKK